MANPKIETAETAAKKCADNMKGMFDNVDLAANLKKPVMPTPKPLPPALHRALGQS
jgi:hypothetical protein